MAKEAHLQDHSHRTRNQAHLAEIRLGRGIMTTDSDDTAVRLSDAATDTLWALPMARTVWLPTAPGNTGSPARRYSSRNHAGLV